MKCRIDHKAPGMLPVALCRACTPVRPWPKKETPAPDAAHVNARARVLERRKIRSLKARVADLQNKLDLISARPDTAADLIKKIEAKLQEAKRELIVNL